MVLIKVSNLSANPERGEADVLSRKQTSLLDGEATPSLQSHQSMSSAPGDFLDARDQSIQIEDPEYAPHTCRHCSKIIIDMRSEPKDDKFRDYIGFTEADVALAAKEGCDLFSAFQKGDYLVSMASGPQNPIWVERTLEPPARVSFRELEMKRSSENVVFTNILVEFVLYTVPGQTPHELFGSQPPPNIVPNSQVSFSRARRFLEDCFANHTRCRGFNLKHMPTRVLEVYSPSDADTGDSPLPFRVRLVSNPAPGPYVTLSYCWGGDQPGKTLKRRLASYSRDIPLDSLPLTIIDALTVTHGVGLKYLWVDALCIIQDSDEDKMAEISNMHRIYRGSILTIAACVAGTSLDGFLRPRIHDRGYVLNVRLDSSNNDSSGEVRQVIGIPVRSRLDETIPPLYTRAWTFQEGQLSTRVLAYGNRGMVYHCLESRHCDGGHEQPIYDTWITKDAIGAGFRYLDPGNQSLSKIAHPCAWGSVLEAYTSRQLTVGDDKLLAVMAIAEEYRRTKPVTEYLAGLWREDFLFQCLWTVYRDSGIDTKFKRPEKYRAPSWSWASLDGHCRMFLHQGVLEGRISYKYCCELLHAETTLMSDNPLGQVKAGIIKLRGRVRQVVWRRDRTTKHDYGYGWAKGDPESKWRRPGELLGDDRLFWYIDVPDEWPLNEEVVMSCMEVCTYEAPNNVMQFSMLQLYEERGGSPNMTNGHGLLLVPVEGQPNTYRRTGVMTCDGYLKGDSSFEKRPYWFDEGPGVLQEVSVI